ncbi:CLIP domain-containing serine protease B15-like [Drosophila subpulchrella]|uniref:CLIP domain-containing serine protease B15-like n=1 Tax=Drosophila subpulchrella TaxID=1486046 RepID=UPI0018A15935|nr:CLIP domain-containing serine protease B15-like [Drosophila subpulchrella]
MRVFAAGLLAILASLFFGESEGLRSLLTPECGKTRRPSRVRRVVGGHDADRFANPWMVMVIRDNGFCSGSLITSLFVLTSASCLFRSPKEVRLGEYDTNCTNGDCLSRRLVIGIDKQFEHPQYDVNQGTKNDIALLRMAREVVYSDYIRPICLAVDMALPRLPQIFTATGWGRTNISETSHILQTTTLNLQNSDLCNDIFFQKLDASQLCVGSEKSDTCFGDSGGPLTARIRYNIVREGTRNRKTTRTFQFGIVSFGSSSCNGLGIYTNVNHYTNWIVNTIANANTPRRG